MKIIQPDEVITWVDVNGNERPMGPTSWTNESEAKACTKISNHLPKIAPKKTKVIVTRFTAHKHIIRNYLQRIGDYNTKVTTTTGGLGTQADIVIFSLDRNNPERNVEQLEHQLSNLLWVKWDQKSCQKWFKSHWPQILQIFLKDNKS